jgi:adhesin transport system membrane fusion protein
MNPRIAISNRINQGIAQIERARGFLEAASLSEAWTRQMSAHALLLEAQIKPQDIAFLRPGQPALVKFTAYDFAIYGGLKAVVEQIGADTVTDDKGNAFYIVRVKTLESSLGKNLPIIPGMVAQVDVMTGKKSILTYLLKPVIRAKANALTER